MPRKYLLRWLDRLGRVYVEGWPHHIAEFYGINLTRLRWIMIVLVPMWGLVLYMHNKPSVQENFMPAAREISAEPEVAAHWLASVPTAMGIFIAVIYIFFVRGRVSIRVAARWGVVAAICILATEGMQLGFAHGNSAHMSSYAIATLLVFPIVPAQAATQAGLLAMTIMVPVLAALATGIHQTTVGNNWLMPLTLPFGTAVMGLVLYYSQFRNFRLRKLAELRLKRRTAEAERARTALQRQWDMENSRIAWLENMASFLRHELRNALVGANVSLQLLTKRNNVPVGDPYHARTERALKIIMELLDNASAATSIESAILQESTDRMDLIMLVREQVEVYKTIYPEQEFILECNLSDTYVRAREERLIQLLDKLVSNAVEHTINNQPVEIVCTRPEVGWVSIKVRNGGHRLPEDHENLFELFASYRAADVEMGRRGMGLYVVRLIVERYGGRVRARDRDDIQGAEFIVDLPTVR